MSSDGAVDLARGGVSALGNKLDDVIDSFRIDAETKAQLNVLAHEAGMSLSEFLRLRLQGAAWGDEHVATVYAQRIRRVLGKVG